MNPDVVELLPIDQRSIAKLLQMLKDGNGIQCRMNKMMYNIAWFLGREPDMIICDKVAQVDVVAESILNMELFNEPFVYYIIEINELSDSCSLSLQPQFIGVCTTHGRDFVSVQITCYEFIDWLNRRFNGHENGHENGPENGHENGPATLADKLIKKITIVAAVLHIIHIRVEI